jgi:hypothetical protein
MKFAYVITGALASHDLLEDVTTLLSTSATEDDAVMLSVNAIRDSIHLAAEDSVAAGAHALGEVSRAQDPRKASELLQQYALSTLEAGQGVDDDTRAKLIAIRDILTNETYISLEQAHRHDQDLLDKHARAINDCGAKHLRHLQLDVEGQEVQFVRDAESTMYECYGLGEHAGLLQEDPQRYYANWTGMFLEEGFVSCDEARKHMLSSCDELHQFVDGLARPNCEAPISTNKMTEPTCDSQPEGIDSDLRDWFVNMKENAKHYHGKWQELKATCDAAREQVVEQCQKCNRKQRIYETAFCSYRQGLHATCREYQGCHVLNEQQYHDLVNTVMYNADSRKIDWKAIHKIECYINVLISTEANDVRAKDLLHCEAGNLNTIQSILTGFNETNYLGLIVPDINASCWDIDIPRYIDFKECDMSSVSQFPCTEKWNDRYNGLYRADSCTECAPIPDEFQYHMSQDEDRATTDDFGGGWYFVNELGRSKTDINDLTELSPGGYHLPEYMTGKLRWNEVLIERVSHNWCDSWGRQSSHWVEDDGASMCIQSDEHHVYCMNNADGHTWRQQPVSHFRKLCGGVDQPECECWPAHYESGEGTKPICWTHGEDATGPNQENIEAPKHIRILPMKDDGSVVKISFQGEMKSGVLRVGNYDAFLQDAGGCNAVTSVKYRVYVRCLGCSTEELEFHTKDGAQFTAPMRMGHAGDTSFTAFTYEAWFKSPLEGRLRREIFGGASTGLTLTNENAVPCMHDIGKGIVAGGLREHGYQLHAGSTEEYGSVCFDSNTWYHVAVTRDLAGQVTTYVNGKNVTVKGHHISEKTERSHLSDSVGGGFTDGGQLFNVRIWETARSAQDIYADAFVTRFDALTDGAGLVHWWPLVDNVVDVITKVPLVGDEVRYAPVWCSDLEKSGMRGC